MSWNDVLEATALEQAGMIRARTISSEELVGLYLGRIARMNPGLNAFVSVFERGALSDARAKDRLVRAGGTLPTFHGVPIGIKDLNFVRGSWTRMGSRATLPIFSPVDDKTTASLRRGGFVILGKLATSEVGAMPVVETDTHAPTRNPWNPRHTAGGSSGGSGSAVASGMLPIAQGSDGGGSIRIPSALNHLYGIKPSRGRVANAFGKPDRDILYTCGPIARSVEDAAAMLDVMAGLDGGSPHWAPPPKMAYRALLATKMQPLKIRFATKNPLVTTHPEIVAAVESAAKLLSSLGHHVEEGDAPDGTLEEFLPLWQHLVSDLPMVRWSRAQPITRWLAAPGKFLDAAKMVELRRSIAARLLTTFNEADVWLTPAVAIPAPEVGAFKGLSPEAAFGAAAHLGAFTAAFNITGQPAASVPVGLTKEGLPIGLQVSARELADDVVLGISRQLEEAAPWRGRRAPMFRGEVG
ncbi:MAG: amidase [Byssovorax sp.]